jgi:hypothetical protein
MEVLCKTDFGVEPMAGSWLCNIDPENSLWI